MATIVTLLPTDRTLRRLSRFRSVRHGVLSLYLDFAPASGERVDIHATVQDALRALGEQPMTEQFRARFDDECKRATDFLLGGFALQGRSLILFSCGPRGLWELFQLQVPVRPLTRFADRPFVSQLAGILDEHERYVVALVDKEQGRIFSVCLNRIEDQIDVRDEYPGRTAMGGWAQARYARHREAHLHRHVLHVTEELLAEARRRPFDRLIVGGPDEAASALVGVLPRSLRSRVVGTFRGELFASDEQLLERVRAMEEAAERRAEGELVIHVLDAASGGGLAVLGWDQTLQALGEGRVHKLLLVEGATRRGRACATGHFAAVEALSACPVCGAAVMTIRDLGEWAAERAFDTDATVETVRGEGALLLKKEQGIGALLRY